MIVDTSALLAFFDAREPSHERVRKCIDESREPLVVSPFVIAELDYLVATRHGVEAELAVLGELSSGAWELATCGAAELAAASQVVATYGDQAIGVADASLVVLAESYDTKDVLTLDLRHFSVLRPLQGGRFKVLPD